MSIKLMLQALVDDDVFLVSFAGTPAYTSPGTKNATQACNYQRGLESLISLLMAPHPHAI